MTASLQSVTGQCTSFKNASQNLRKGPAGNAVATRRPISLAEGGREAYSGDFLRDFTEFPGDPLTFREDRTVPVVVSLTLDRKLLSIT
jgi:hypothetical protein